MAEPSRTTEQIVSQFLSKSLNAILSARIPHLLPSAVASGRPSAHRKRDRWFHLALPDLPDLLPPGVSDPLIIDILLSPRDSSSSSPESVVERWVAHCEIPPPWAQPESSDSFLVKRTYKKSIILLRSIYSVLRLLPAQRVFKMLCATNQSYNYDISYRISSFAAPFSRQEETEFRSHSFSPVETQFGQLAVSVQYRPSLSHFNFEISSLLPPMLIADYVGSPITDPMRAFPSSPSPNSSLFPTATSAPSRFLHEPRPSTSAPASAPLFHRQNSFDGPANRLLPPQHRKSFDEYRLSPPFYMSPTPSPPTFSSSYMQSRLRGDTSAPVSIPQSGSRNPGFRSPVSSDPVRNFLPPPSPRSVRTGLDPAGLESPLESRSFRKAEGLKVSDALLKGLKDGRDDSGRFSGPLSSDSPRFGVSRSSSRISDLEDADFQYPFAVDDVDSASDSQLRSNEELGHATSSSHKSHEAAVGALVHMLKNASPLRDSTFSSQFSRSELNQESLGGNSNSSSFLSRKTSDALDELQSYKEIKEMLVRESRN